MSLDSRWCRRACAVLFSFGVAAAGAAAQVGASDPPRTFEEEFAYGDRKAALARLAPGSEEHFYYACLERQHAGDLAAVDALLRDWITRHGRDERVTEIEHRQALLGFSTQPDATWEHLSAALSLRFDDQPDVPGARPELPTRLDPALVAEDAWRERAFAFSPFSFEGFREAALVRYAAGRVPDRLLTALLAQLRTPDVPNLPELVARQLRFEDAGAFGSLTIHQRLTLVQLHACAKLLPELTGRREWVDAVLARLAPTADEDTRRDPTARLAHLERLAEFVEGLPATFDSLRAHVRYHRLAHDLAAGVFDRARFLAYVRLPRPSLGVNPALIEDSKGVVDLARAFPTGLAPIRDDHALVRAYLGHFLRDAQDASAFAELFEQGFLDRVFAETKLLAGSGDAKRWYELVGGAAAYAALEQRVEIEFPPTRREWFAADEPVVLDVDVKNVPALLVKVYEVHALNYYLEEKREIDAGLALDGLVANEEQRFQYAESPIRRVRRTFELPRLAAPGVYVVEFVGNGVASRALVRKGALRVTERIGAAGHVFRAYDERGAPQRAPVLHLDGRRYSADERGEVLVPFTSKRGLRSIVVESGPRVALTSFEQREESYHLDCGAWVEREALLAGARAQLFVRATLSLHGNPASLELLEQPVLRVISTDVDGVVSSLELRDVKLSSTAELVHEIAVPERLAKLSVELHAQVKSVATGVPIDLDARADALVLNQIDATAATDCPLLSRAADGWSLELRGRNGEPRQGRTLELLLHHRDYAREFQLRLQTDADGRIALGELPGVDVLQTSGSANRWMLWRLADEQRAWPDEVHAVAGEPLRLPYPTGAPAPTRTDVALFEMRDDVYVRDAFEQLRLVDGALELAALAPGEYALVLRRAARTIRIDVASGAVHDGWIFGASRALQRSAPAPLAVVELREDGDALLVRLAGAEPDARVHVWATRYAPAFDAYDAFVSLDADEPRALAFAAAPSEYHAGHEIGDEYRYVLERRLARKFPGNLLARPGLLLQPWAVDVTSPTGNFGTGVAPFGSRRIGVGGKGRKALGVTRATESVSPGGTVPNLDFLGAPAVVHANLRPDAAGRLRVPLASLGDRQHVHVVALDARERAYASLARALRPTPTRDLRLAASFDAAKHLGEQRGIEFVPANGALVIDETATSALESYAALADVYRYFRTQGNAPELARFEFLTRWPSLSSAEQRSAYSVHACHELNLFLRRRDPTFFEAVVRPHLEHKHERTFLDEWLLDAPLERYLEPWAFAQLNVVEQILLAQRVGDPATARSVRERVELLAPDPAGDERRFAAALAGDALSAALKTGSYRGPGDTAAPGARGGAAGGAAPATPGPAGPSGGGAENAKKVEEKALDQAEAEDAREPSSEALQQDRDALRRAEVTKLYRPLGDTQILAETDYWRVRRAAQDAELVEPSPFWLDFAQTPVGQPFVSPHFTHATNSVTEMLLALAVLDLPFTASEPQVESSGGKRTLRPSGPLLAARKDVRERAPAAAADPLLVSQDYLRLDDRVEFDGQQERDKFARGELLSGVAYACRVVVTNPTSSERELELLLQVPAGALPLDRGRKTRGLRVHLDGYDTEALEYAFYFPRAGSFAHYPVHVVQGGALVAFAAPATLTVVDTPSASDAQSWEHVSQRGTLAEVLAYLERANVERVELAKLAWRMRDRAAYDAIRALLRARHAFEPALWSYALFHRDADGAREYLRWRRDFLDACGPYLESPLARIDPVELHAYEHLEFDPLVYPRAHRFGEGRGLVDANMRAQREQFLAILAHRPALDARDRLAVTYQLLLEDRVEEALASFASIDATSLRSRMQYDYLAAYLAFFADDPTPARAIAERYRDYPVDRWRTRFANVLAQLDEAAGQSAVVADPTDRAQQQGALASAEPALDLAVEGRVVKLAWRNLEQCEVSYYPMDLELSFSAKPFVDQDARAFAFIRPRRTDTVALAKGQSERTLELPADLGAANVLVEVRAGGIVRRQPCLQGTLRVQWLTSYGQLAVTQASTGKPLSKAYVKVYARSSSGVRFHKDGYTDLRGRFDYATVTGSNATDVERFAILVASESDGALLGEVAPPAR